MAGDEVERYRRAVNPARLAALELAGGPLEIRDARGAWIVDADGRRYLDLVAGYGTAVLGHRHPRVTSALAGVLEEGPPFTHPVGVPARAGRLAETLVTRAGHDLERVVFGTSGAEGIEIALKLAMAATGRGIFVAFEGAFHGFTLAALSLAGAETWRAPFAAAGAEVERVPFGNLEAVERALARRPVAAVVAEPVQGMAGVRALPDEALRHLADLCRDRGALLVLDEVLTGLGRCGRWLAAGVAGDGFRPDVVVVSKALTGGAVPCCAVLARREVHDALYPDLLHAGGHASTFEAHLLAMTAGLAVLETIYEEDLLARVRRLGRELERRLAELRDRGAALARFRVHGLLVGLEVDERLRHGELWGAPAAQRRLLEGGVVTKVAPQAPGVLTLTPPFTLTDSELDLFGERLGTALA